MTNEQILKKAILKAEKNGYTGHTEYMPLFLKRGPEKSKKFSKEELLDMMSKVWLRQKNDIIFSCSFAEAFWGDKAIKVDFTFEYDGDLKDSLYANLPTKIWQVHLQTMILWDEPLKYLEKFLEEENETKRYNKKSGKI